MPSPEDLPRCPNLDGSSLRIVPAYTEAGRLCEANCVTITDGERTAVYVPIAATAEDLAAQRQASADVRRAWLPHYGIKPVDRPQMSE